MGRVYSEELVIALATAIALLDIFFILACVPESLPEKVRASHVCSVTGRANAVSTGSGQLSWDMVDPFAVSDQPLWRNALLVLFICDFLRAVGIKLSCEIFLGNSDTGAILSGSQGLVQ